MSKISHDLDSGSLWPQHTPPAPRHKEEEGPGVAVSVEGTDSQRIQEQSESEDTYSRNYMTL